MKAITNHITYAEKELFIKLLILSTITIGVCSNIKIKRYSPVVVPVKDIAVDPLSDFDQVPVANNVTVINSLISSLGPKLSADKKKSIAKKIHKTLLKYPLPPQVVLAIIDTESNFRQDAVSSTGDLSMAQINPDVWNKEFERLKKPLIDAEKLQADETYALEMMARILTLLKKRHEKTDRRWYARYHSGTKKYKEAYLNKIEVRMRKMETNTSVALH